jgi:small conductance mechanosensitive channel
LPGNNAPVNWILAQVVDLGTDVDRIADNLESVQITWITGLTALAVVIAGLVVARLARNAIMKLGEQTDIASPEAFKLASRIVLYSIVMFAVGAALGVLGFDVVPLISALGVIAVIIAVGLQPFIQNFTAGVTLQTRRPFQAGDQVVLLDVEGTVLEISARSVIVETVGGEIVHLPNRSVLDNRIVNLSAPAVRRSTIEVGLDYATDLARAEATIRSAVQNTAGVAGEPAAQVFVHEFAESTINASVWFWHAPQIREAWAVRHRVALNVKQALDAAGITIAFPQRVLWNAQQAEVDR